MSSGARFWWMTVLVVAAFVFGAWWRGADRPLGLGVGIAFGFGIALLFLHDAGPDRD